VWNGLGWRDPHENEAGLSTRPQPARDTIPPVIWLYFSFVMVAHEASHALALWAFRIRFAPRVWYSRDFPWLGFGWKYFVDGIDPRQRRTVLVVGPMVESILWLLGALFFPDYFLPLIVMAALTLLLNRMVPGGDLWKAQRLPRPAPGLLTAGDQAPGQLAVPAGNREP